jgi:hypothetical protein
MTGVITHLIYWAGMAIIAIVGFGVVGGAFGLVIRDHTIEGVALAFALLVMGLLLTVALGLIWRGMCEFYLAIFRIAEDLRALRAAQDAAASPAPQPAPPREF